MNSFIDFHDIRKINLLIHDVTECKCIPVKLIFRSVFSLICFLNKPAPREINL